MYTYVYLSFHSIEQEAKSFKCQPNWVAQRQRRRRRRWSTNQLCARAGGENNTEEERKRTNPKRKIKREAKNERKGTIDNIGNLLRVELMPQLRQAALASHSPPAIFLCMCHKTTHISLCSQLKEKLRLPRAWRGEGELRPRGLSLRLLWLHTLLLNEELMLGQQRGSGVCRCGFR